jgi:hypothetical protein
MFSVASIIYPWDNQVAYAQAFVADLSDEQMILRPGGNMNHPAWILGHIGAYHQVVQDLLANRPVNDPKNDMMFGFAGHGPLDDLSKYGSKQSIIDRFSAGHEQVAQALLAAPPEAFTRKPTLERWAKIYPTVEFMLPDLLLHHESLHLGQISIWRRAAGLPAVKQPERKIRSGLISA